MYFPTNGRAKDPEQRPIGMTGQDADIKALADAFDLFTRTTQSMEESYRRLEARLLELDRELESKNRELALTSDYLNSIMESMSDGVIAVDTEGTVTTFNRAAGHVLGFNAGETVGRPFIDVFGRDFAVPPGTHFMELRAKDGRVVHVTERDSPLFDRSRVRIGTVKVFQDQTEIESLRRRLAHQDRLAAIGEMAATVAHEIRNPLGGIRGFAALLARDLDAADPRSRLVEKIIVGAKELERVVSDLLEYARPLQLRLRATPCRELVESALGYIEAGDKDVEIENTVSDSELILADPDKVRQVLLNVFLNAVQSIDGKGTLRVSAETGDGYLTLLVSDSGCGMSPDQIEQIFSPFYTTKEKGTGLGLAIAAKVVDAHGGSIGVESEPGKGSMFRIRFPRAE